MNDTSCTFFKVILLIIYTFRKKWVIKMALIDDLINKIDDKDLRESIQNEVSKLSKQKKLGLVFEDHLPEFTPLYELTIKEGSSVTYKKDSKGEIYHVIKILENEATCVHKSTKETSIIPLNELVVIAEFGESIYPYLKQVDYIENEPNDKLWHLLIESDNFHALQLLEYLYAEKIDCIYIDPPYNTGAKDWKYNNNFVDDNDSFRHSKWLSFMDKRLKLAKKLLNPSDSVLIVTIDEKEYLNLGILLRQLFPEARIQMVSTVINPKGVSRNGFSRSDEYIYFVMFGSSVPSELKLSVEWSSSVNSLKSLFNKENTTKVLKPEWTSMMRRGNHSYREDSYGLYYPIYVDEDKKIVKVGEVVPKNQSRLEDIDGLTQVLPLRKSGAEGVWQLGPDELRRRISKGYIRVGSKSSYGYVINYLSKGQIEKVESGLYGDITYLKDGSVDAKTVIDTNYEYRKPPTAWKLRSHDSSLYGSTLLNEIFKEKRFSFPKSLYAVHDVLKFFLHHKPEAKVLDFFAGSGTTQHAINLMNKIDNGKRLCISVTNNEVSDKEAKDFAKQNIKINDPEYEERGIARYVTWPRTVSVISGNDVNNLPLEGEYLGTNFKMSEGFKTNVIYFKLGFLDKEKIARGRHLRELLPILWMKAGIVGKCPVITDDELNNSFGFIFPENTFAILLKESDYSEFEAAVKKYDAVRTVYIVTNSSEGFFEMSQGFKDKKTVQLYLEYLENFKINTGGK